MKAKISPFLWFDHQAEEAANFYCSIFPNSKILEISRYSEAGQENHRRPPGSVMVVSFELDGQKFSALNGGPIFHFSCAVSFVVDCETQEEIDYYWEKLGAGGAPEAQQCGWLADRFGLSWQIVPAFMDKLFTDAESPGAKRAITAMMRMKKLDIAALQAAYDG
ncbi:VOC family protein [Luteolibacter arcticus]|uniref:VOC family protein n=1 Tax=Luteolibacter arcticus TaxID=1581411 RepID=A0ABT3GPJ3_9BACT|nr:VOC family protein [Luteolibacter arcticus]MCW1925439.1 VOC family protein [Luteolibacter arcticus]